MDAQFGNYTLPADNKGILSLLTAIEQSEDHEPDTSPSKMVVEDKEPLSVSTDNFTNLNLETLEMSGEINLANLNLCLICGRNMAVESAGMIDINTLIEIPGEESRSIQSVIEEIIPITKNDPIGGEDSGYTCVDCFLLVDGILKLRSQIQEYMVTLKTKHTDWVAKRKSSTKLPELLEFRIPISILNVRDDVVGDGEEPTTEDLSELAAVASAVTNATSHHHSVVGEDTSQRGDPSIHVTSLPPPPSEDHGVVGEEGFSSTTAPTSSTLKKSKLQILAETLEDERRSPSSVVETEEFTLSAEGLDAGNGLNADNQVVTTTNTPSKNLMLTKSIDPAQLHQIDRNTSDKENQSGSSCLNCGARLVKPGRFTSSSKTDKSRQPLCHTCNRNSKGEKVYPCKYCSIVFKSKSLWEEHRKVKHPSGLNQYECSKCEKVFASKQSRTKHENSVHKVRPEMECEECGECFQSYQTLQFHKSRHTGEFSYSCRHCGKGFNNYKLMEEHEHIHTGKKPYSCTMCTKSFANRGSLWLHVKKHQTTKPYTCDYCAKGFGHASHLAVHKRMHTGEKPYACRLCQERFVSGNHLKRHMKSHQNEDPFACGLCDKTFKKRSDLSQHGNSDHGGRIVDAATMDDVNNHSKEDTLQLVRGRHTTSLFDDFNQAATSLSRLADPDLNNKTSLHLDRNTKELLVVNQTPGNEILSLPKLTGQNEHDFVLPVNILEEDNTKDGEDMVGVGVGSAADQPIVFIQVSGASHSGFGE
eukprot:TRINITY_DN8126_c0_g1_i11.p1 TRINITY_DN8126_c0_g1~~TRINITY_DN8126_c0_g1_i11.p1  ORF type:complete len:757 (+),score=125.22 TRINITY_DN8126_c0_g1_i11:140-2410(+)